MFSCQQYFCTAVANFPAAPIYIYIYVIKDILTLKLLHYKPVEARTPGLDARPPGDTMDTLVQFPKTSTTAYTSKKSSITYVIW